MEDFEACIAHLTSVPPRRSAMPSFHPRQRSPLRPPGRVIPYDPDGTLAAAGEPSPSPPTEPPIRPLEKRVYVEWYLWMLRQAYAWAKRGAQHNYRSFNKLRAAVDSLRRVRNGLIEMRLWTLGRARLPGQSRAGDGGAPCADFSAARRGRDPRGDPRTPRRVRVRL